jgi:hypothetical protein
MADFSERLMDDLQGDSSMRVLDIGKFVLADLIVVQIFPDKFI